MTSLPLFHRVMVSRTRNLDHRRAANLLAESVGGRAPLLVGAQRDVDLAAETLAVMARCRPGSERTDLHPEHLVLALDPRKVEPLAPVGERIDFAWVR